MMFLTIKHNSPGRSSILFSSCLSSLTTQDVLRILYVDKSKDWVGGKVRLDKQSWKQSFECKKLQARKKELSDGEKTRDRADSPKKQN